MVIFHSYVSLPEGTDVYYPHSYVFCYCFIPDPGRKVLLRAFRLPAVEGAVLTWHVPANWCAYELQPRLTVVKSNIQEVSIFGHWAEAWNFIIHSPQNDEIAHVLLSTILSLWCRWFDTLCRRSLSFWEISKHLNVYTHNIHYNTLHICDMYVDTDTETYYTCTCTYSNSCTYLCTYAIFNYVYIYIYKYLSLGNSWIKVDGIAGRNMHCAKKKMWFCLQTERDVRKKPWTCHQQTLGFMNNVKQCQQDRGSKQQNFGSLTLNNTKGRVRVCPNMRSAPELKQNQAIALGFGVKFINWITLW